MNKKILALAIGAAMAAPLAAQADLKISGRVAGELVSAGGNVDGISFTDYGNTRIQFDASDESGFFARWAADLRDSKYSGSGTSTRDYFVGYKGGFGALMGGKLAGASKNLEGDKYIGTFLELRTGPLLGGSGNGKFGSSGFINNLIEYNNKFGDATVKLQYNATDNTPTATEKGHIGASIKAKLAGANVFAGYNNMTTVAPTDSTYKVGGDMSFGDINARLVYEDVAGTTNWVVGAGFKAAGGSLDVDYGDKGRDGTNAFYRVGFYKKASKKAHWWVGYVQNGANTSGVNANTGTYGGGIRVDF